MKVPPIMKTIICPDSFSIITDLYKSSFNPHSMLPFSPWTLHPIKKHWCWPTCSCAPHPSLQSFRPRLSLRAFPYGSQYDLHYRDEKQRIRIHMPWETLASTWSILTVDPGSLDRILQQVHSTCLTLPHRPRYA